MKNYIFGYNFFIGKEMNMDIFEIKKKNEQNNAEIEEIRRHL